MAGKVSSASRESPRVTIVMTARERHDLTEAAIDSIVRETTVPFRLIYAEGHPPEWLRRTLSRRAKEWGLEIVEFDAPLWPNQIRRRIMPKIDTDYVVFIDNDVSVKPGWLENLVACADETGAGIVGPLYFIGADPASTRIHMAGGRLNEIRSEEGLTLEEAHHLGDKDASRLESDLRREKCDFAEYHCMLIRTKLAKEAPLFDDSIVCVHEHIDASLEAKKAGYATYVEPSSKVTYLAFVPYRLSDLSFFRARWAAAAAESSIKAFAAKWDVLDNEQSFGGVRWFVQWHRTNVDPLRRSGSQGAAPDRPMQSSELEQTPSGLFDLAKSRGYRPDDLALLEQAYRLAMYAMNGVYRPCGRPLVNHLAGTASVLIHYDFTAPIVTAGLLHTAYSHCAPMRAGAQAAIDNVCRLLGGKGTPVESLVAAYTFRSHRWKELLESPVRQSVLTLQDAEVLAIAAANEADMHLSGEFRTSGRRDMESPDVVGLMTDICKTLGVTGLAETVRIESENLALIPVKSESKIRNSFRIVGDKVFPATFDAIRAALEQIRTAE